MIFKSAVLPALLLSLLVFAGCSQESPYTDQTAEFDPALQTDNPDTNPTMMTHADNNNADRNSGDTPPANPPKDGAQAEAIAQAKGDADTKASSTKQLNNASLSKAGKKVELTDAQWKQILSDKEYYILRQSGTEYAGTGRYLKLGKSDKGAYHCVGCGNKLYDAKHKFHSGCGWPSFNQEVEPGAITTIVDKSAGMIRTEMRCARCDGHLGHIFDDGFDQPTGLRHCVNGYALIFIPQGEDPKDVIRKHREQNADR